ncbi:unnamed protein product [Ostreobium quekettii]|uniref:RING-type domain-containing protein n=1 Tax=Ostreobium quekettii TaxID=121088 RepID=A0A8S1J492_9CHLO|nr:unnamed protein product [Ostreobium quekettii]
MGDAAAGGCSSSEGDEDLHSSADVDEAPFPFEDSDCEAGGWRRGGGRGGNPRANTLAPHQLDRARLRDVHLIARVCDIAEDTAHELLVRQGWDHQKVLELHCPFRGDCRPPAADTDCPVCLESCVLPTSDKALSFHLCGHPMHWACAGQYAKNQVDSMAGMAQETFLGSITCPWCIANKEDTPGFLTECQVCDLIGPTEFKTYKQVRRNMLARNERHCPREGCTNVVRFLSAGGGASSCLTLECACGHRFCRLCGCVEHWPVSCEDFASYFRLQEEMYENTQDLQQRLDATTRKLREVRNELANQPEAARVRQPVPPFAQPVLGAQRDRNQNPIRGGCAGIGAGRGFGRGPGRGFGGGLGRGFGRGAGRGNGRGAGRGIVRGTGRTMVQEVVQRPGRGLEAGGRGLAQGMVQTWHAGAGQELTIELDAAQEAARAFMVDAVPGGFGTDPQQAEEEEGEGMDMDVVPLGRHEGAENQAVPPKGSELLGAEVASAEIGQVHVDAVERAVPVVDQEEEILGMEVMGVEDEVDAQHQGGGMEHRDTLVGDQGSELAQGGRLGSSTLLQGSNHQEDVHQTEVSGVCDAGRQGGRLDVWGPLEVPKPICLAWKGGEGGELCSVDGLQHRQAVVDDQSTVGVWHPGKWWAQGSPPVDRAGNCQHSSHGCTNQCHGQDSGHGPQDLCVSTAGDGIGDERQLQGPVADSSDKRVAVRDNEGGSRASDLRKSKSKCGSGALWQGQPVSPDASLPKSRNEVRIRETLQRHYRANRPEPYLPGLHLHALTGVFADASFPNGDVDGGSLLRPLGREGHVHTQRGWQNARPEQSDNGMRTKRSRAVAGRRGQPEGIGGSKSGRDSASSRQLKGARIEDCEHSPLQFYRGGSDDGLDRSPLPPQGDAIGREGDAQARPTGKRLSRSLHTSHDVSPQGKQQKTGDRRGPKRVGVGGSVQVGDMGLVASDVEEGQRRCSRNQGESQGSRIRKKIAQWVGSIGSGRGRDSGPWLIGKDAFLPQNGQASKDSGALIGEDVTSDDEGSDAGAQCGKGPLEGRWAEGQLYASDPGCAQTSGTGSGSILDPAQHPGVEGSGGNCAAGAAACPGGKMLDMTGNPPVVLDDVRAMDLNKCTQLSQDDDMSIGHSSGALMPLENLEQDAATGMTLDSARNVPVRTLGLSDGSSSGVDAVPAVDRTGPPCLLGRAYEGRGYADQTGGGAGGDAAHEMENVGLGGGAPSVVGEGGREGEASRDNGPQDPSAAQMEGHLPLSKPEGREADMTGSDAEGPPSHRSLGQDASQDSAATTVQEAGNSTEETSYIARHTKDCPRCFSLCEKIFGCDHVTCPRCHHHFCWRCRADWKQSGGYRHLERCSGENRVVPTRQEAERQFHEFLKQHDAVAVTLVSKEQFVRDWMRRETEMRTKFQYQGPWAEYQGGLEWDGLLDERIEVVEARVQRQQEEEARLQDRVAEQTQQLEWRQRYHVSRALQEKERGLRGLPITETDGVRQLSHQEFAAYQQIIAQGQSVDRAVRILKDIKAHTNELQPLSEGYCNLAQVLLSCERTRWACLLDSFFNKGRRLTKMVEFCVGELEHVKEVYLTLEAVITPLRESDEGSSSSSGSASTSGPHHRYSLGSLANQAEYYSRKRDNFILAWEAQMELPGEFAAKVAKVEALCCAGTGSFVVDCIEPRFCSLSWASSAVYPH